ncbi:hypothetical protein N7495_000389 [Penicillium taxi]|uniref:uncharacterized protein n=1 Tax=Penicillium taxi TaxID=168475 RepID=UPI0025455BF3|nr:uncharacterized protein N7495_000389 [Penicillium taxi]KAJ5907707.1 hypothetical protein N7495_000389 [Penicillium taxi]
MKIIAFLTLATLVTCEFTCIKPVNPIPAGPPGVCCKELLQSQLLSFLYTGKMCTNANELSEAADGTTTYSSCDTDQHAACCDPLLMKLYSATNVACVLPESTS